MYELFLKCHQVYNWYLMICIHFYVVYVGAATVAASAWWFMYYEGGPQMNYYQLVGFLVVVLSSVLVSFKCFHSLFLF